MNMDQITVDNFVHILISECGEKPGAEGIARRITDGYVTGDLLDRRGAAKITHLFIRDVFGIKDLDNINPAEKLRDLYDCRVCVNHIAQIYLRGIMDAIKMESATGDPFFIFDGKGTVSVTDAQMIAAKVSKLLGSSQND